MNDKIQQHLSQIEKEIIHIRRHLHQHPEISNHEVETSKLIQHKLAGFGIPFETGFAKTGVLGIIQGDKPGKTVALRADMDALPIQELNDHAYTSIHDNAMHACGHDAHTAMLLGAGYILSKMKEYIHGTVLLVFQPAEENSPIGGAKVMLDDGVFDTYKPDVIYGQHVWPNLPVGTMGIRDTKMMGATDRFKLVIRGKGGHASMPHQTSDSVVTAGHMITSLQTVVSRNVDPLEASVLTIAKIEGGSTHNVITDCVILEGSIRSYSSDVKKTLKERFHTIVDHTASMFEADVEIDYLDGYPATINTPEWAALARTSAQKVLGEDATPEVEPSLAGEDFSRFLQKYPGAFIWLGTQIENKEEQKALHNPRFQLNEDALPNGSAFFVQLALDTLEKLGEE
ncbi:M20 metallopeptidase family protein [Virgibacillus necropolis]|uniref:Carboxypeptidase n=1 Tax=Virgibacillus necropolis TaxID=163877 RepID=A0A221M953_9BACI|nr:M20 family metallopeptidase [Virgibacillus necropolis]ASN04150.1 carboxypeptidase [Virgibacillus necropolis]